MYSERFMRSAATIATLVLVLAGTAAAQPGMTAPTAPLSRPPVPGELLSESKALALSVGGTLASWGAFVAVSSTSRFDGSAQGLGTVAAFGTLLAPTFGHWYAGSIVTRGLGVRVLGVGSAFAGAVISFGRCSFEGEGRCEDADLGVALLLAGAVLYVAGTADDIATVSARVRRRNSRMMGITVVPALRSDSSGIAIAGRF